MGKAAKWLEAAKWARLEIESPELPDVAMFAQELPGAQREALAFAFKDAAELEDRNASLEGMARVQERIALESLVDEAGTRLLEDAELDDFRKLPFTLVDRIVEAALKINQFHKESDAEIEEEAGKSDATEATDSAIGSPSPSESS